MNNKIGVNLLRQTGIILIALPEPLTTVLGIACIVAAQYISSSRGNTYSKFIGRKKLNKFPEDFFLVDEFDTSSRRAKPLNYYSYDRCKRHRTSVRNPYKRYIMNNLSDIYVKQDDNHPCCNTNIIPNLKHSIRIKAKELIQSREYSNLHINTEIINPELNIDALTRRYQYISESNNANNKIVKCNIDMQKLQRYKDKEKQQYESSKIKISESRIQFHDIDMDALIKRYNNHALRHTLAE
jgi:hypothetical protein